MTVRMVPCGPSSGWRPEHSVDVAGTLAVHWRGHGDPAHRVMSDGAVWRTCRTIDGPATVRVRCRPADGEVAATAWGPGAPIALDALPQWLGADDDPAGFRPNHPLLARAARRHAGLRLSRTALVMEALVPAVLEQKVTGRGGACGWRSLLLRFGDPAPGPAPDGMRVVPTPQRWASLPSWEWHRAGVGPNRSGTVVRAARLARQLEDVANRSGHDVESVADGAGHRRMDRRRGQAASAGRSGCCVCGHFHLPRLVAYNLAGEERADDDRMLELLEPYSDSATAPASSCPGCSPSSPCASPARPRLSPDLTRRRHGAPWISG